ncbi:alternate signal-mediated exported protein [Isoptericola sp. CG 20/1183]|uniref:Alternate signal-mediated exported protein n=1 Tax=Isoptericola halotolerans TaxID=300560 RepID=A0ABX5EAS8_9MICO|nr:MULTISPECIES: alternate-type signal peptide domain-containing protein [Isoptericola]MCK0115554.1 alternate-type signal peptide domain-containing protein [Isoptericola sp. S6320L]PRZ04370.1 alternate signal-mediated exported protein [Isoptericola halotolerans]PRZ04732.1 alternate signal-mediated exported protein [Isoptericola sp. CG 20/1183]
MKRLTKAALATGGGALLLLGGAQTLAYWTADGTATGTDMTAGTLTMSDGTCGEWLLDDGTPVTEGIVPGDTLSTTCTLAVGGTGDHLALGEITVSDPAWAEANALTAALDVSLAEATLGGTALTLPLVEPVPVAATDELVVSVDAVFDTTAGNDTQGLVAALEDITVQVTQAHDVP